MIELKKEYTTLLCQVLTPVILEGLQHLYNESKKNSTKNNILKTFQLLLKSIPSWDTDIVKKEIERLTIKYNKLVNSGVEYNHMKPILYEDDKVDEVY
jgi:hypothetical protein